MRIPKNSVILGATLLLCLANVWVGYLGSSVILEASGAAGICYVLLRIVWFSKVRQKSPPPAPSAKPAPVPRAAPQKPIDPNDTDALIERMLQEGRYALLLRPQVVGRMSEAQFRRALHALNTATALVPDGDVVLGRMDEALVDGQPDGEETATARERIVQVERFFLDRYPVTNAEYYQFVAGGGYEQMSLWDKLILPAVLDLVDRTGMPGPRYWENGRFPPGEERHPVVGVSWYEAGAYARWVGKRLPSDAEWVKAGSWPVPLSSNTRVQRKYPWGDTMDRQRANLWGSGPERIVSVDQFAEGMSVGGVYHLIGNVWEWTSGSFRPSDHRVGDLVLPTPMKNIRGGAFDTYFDNQATCQFQSGENPLHRRRNIGFRCAVGVCDLILARPAPARAPTDTSERAPQPPDPETEEVHA